MLLVNPLEALRRSLRPAAKVKTPTLLQMEAVECGAASLGMILGYYGRIVPLAELRQACGVSRDGVTAANVLKAARRYGLMAKGYKKRLETLVDLKPPFMVFWHFNHFLVVDGFGKDKVFLNDPAAGPRIISWQEFDEGYTGIVLTTEPGENFEPGGQKPSLVKALTSRLRGAVGGLVFSVLVSFMLVIPSLVLPAFSQVFVDNVLIGGRTEWLPYVMTGMMVIVALQAVLTLFQLRYLRALKVKLAVGMASRFVWHVLRLPVGFYAQRFAGEISSRVRLNDQVSGVLSGRLTSTIISVFMVIFYAIAMLYYDVILTLIVIFFAVINVMVLQWVSRQRTDSNLRLAQEQGKAAGVAIAGLQGIETLKASGLETDFFSRWAGYYTKAINVQQELGLMNRVVGVLPSLLSSLAAMSLLVIGGFRVLNGELTIGMLLAFQLLMRSFQGPVNGLVSFGSTLQTLQSSLQRLDDVLNNDIDPELQSAVPPVQSQNPHHSQQPHQFQNPHQSQNPKSKIQNPKPLHRLQGYIELQNISFGYHPLEAPLVEDFSFHIKPGQRIAFVGGSGSGKSTLAKVVAGLYQPWSGEILFDGMERSQIPRAVLTNSIAVVEQDIVLFEGTVRENLTLWDSTIPDRDIRRACQDAAIEDIILSIPCGYDAELLEGATNLSGGQRQRMEIARALVNNPSILIMDEATSALDTETEKIIDQNLRRRGCTCLIVAHRLSTIRDADEIIVLDRGKVVQRGTHEELWQQDGHYARLIRSDGGSLSTQS
ncbi:MAG: NHLP family bacteriocin export ABC transporter peptidase/permease/ATPase subunit [Cyanothece sp. SIO2G6]|nr:NHLP family bacteriocin export ABC transporter peptidase/permease/ATPase subunit [Cyanothece sp. SIO2G6]